MFDTRPKGLRRPYKVRWKQLQSHVAVLTTTESETRILAEQVLQGPYLGKRGCAVNEIGFATSISIQKQVTLPSRTCEFGIITTGCYLAISTPLVAPRGTNVSLCDPPRK